MAVLTFEEIRNSPPFLIVFLSRFVFFLTVLSFFGNWKRVYLFEKKFDRAVHAKNTVKATWSVSPLFTSRELKGSFFTCFRSLYWGLKLLTSDVSVLLFN